MRGFFSGGGGKKDSSKTARTKALMIQQIQKGGVVKETPEEKYKKMLQTKMDELMMQAQLGGGMKNGVKQPEKKLSEKTKKLVLQMAAIKVRRQEALERQRIVIKKKTFDNGGRMDAQGKLYNSKGELVGMVDAKNGQIKNKLGFTVGKYKDNYMGNFKLKRMTDVMVKPGVVPGASPTANPYAPTPSAPVNIFSSFDNKDEGGWW